MAWTRRQAVRILAGAAGVSVARCTSARQETPTLTEQVGWAEHVPVRWVEPTVRRDGVNAVIWLSGFGGTAAWMSRYLQELGRAGFVAVSFDHWQHGRREVDLPGDLGARVFANFRRRMWPILGNGVLDTARVIDWMQHSLQTSAQVHVGGLSMGGDIAVAAAGHDPRIAAVAAVVATPDWLRPGMRNSSAPGQPLIPPGEPDSYARYFYEAFNPLTNLARYDRAPFIAFECAANDSHVPPEAAARFKSALERRSAQAAANVRVTLHPGLVHGDLETAPVFFDRSLEWFQTH